MNPNLGIATEGNNPREAAERLGVLVDKIIRECPGAVILVARIISTCDAAQQPRTAEYQNIIPDVIGRRRVAGAHVLVVDFTTFPIPLLRDCIHPSIEGYKVFGDYWINFVNQIPPQWIRNPIGPDPVRVNLPDLNANGGLDGNIPPPNWGDNPVAPSNKATIASAARIAGQESSRVCDSLPHWQGTGQIALGLGSNGDWRFRKNWVSKGKVADGIGRDHKHVRYALALVLLAGAPLSSPALELTIVKRRLVDMNGDGKAGKWLYVQSNRASR
jgi:hypothetical protein